MAFIATIKCSKCTQVFPARAADEAFEVLLSHHNRVHRSSNDIEAVARAVGVYCDHTPQFTTN